MRTPFLRVLHGGRHHDDDPRERKATDESVARVTLYPSRRTIEVAPLRDPDDDPPKAA